MKNWSLFIALSILVSCSPKNTSPIVKKAPKPVVEKPVKERTTSCVTFDDLSASDRDMAETAYVLFKDFIKTNDFVQAKKHWEVAYNLAPASNGRVKYQFDDGVRIYTDLFNKATNKALKQTYVDTVMMIYDKRVECFGDQAYIDGRKAFDYYYTFPEFSDEEKTYALFKKAVDGKGEKADYFIINPFTKLLNDRFVEGKTPLAEAQKYANTLWSALDYGPKNCKRNCDVWDVINNYSPTILETLEGADNFYDCEYYTNKYYALFEANPEDCEIINKVYSRLLRGGCTPNNPQVTQVKSAKDTKCYTPPPQEGPLKIAYRAYTEGRYKDAVKGFDDFVQSTDDNAKKAKYNLLIAKIYYGDLKNFSKSRTYALAAAKFKSNWGEPYILIGKLYASSGALCGPGTGWDSQIVTWPAIDKFKYAKKIDPSVAAEANKWITTYQKYMPTKEDIFSRSKKAGDTFKVGCWIRETTKIRTAD